MRHYVAYHNAERMGYPYEPSGEYSFLSKKALTFLEKTVGSFVWVINGSRIGSKKTSYTLCAVYIPDQVIDVEDTDFDYIVSGTVGFEFNPVVELNSLPWFPEFLKSQANFSIGISAIHDAKMIGEFTMLTQEDIQDLAGSIQYELPSDVDIAEVGGEEGLPIYVSHLRRERNSALVQAKKTKVLAEYGRLQCEVCGFDFAVRYGSLGEGYCEVHHKIPLASLDGSRITKLAELAVVCSNCHRILHRNHQALATVEELRAQINLGMT
ncbi:MAG: HNH endonuclease [Thermodesulfobacteriota bacterium]